MKRQPSRSLDDDGADSVFGKVWLSFKTFLDDAFKKPADVRRLGRDRIEPGAGHQIWRECVARGALLRFLPMQRDGVQRMRSGFQREFADQRLILSCRGQRLNVDAAWLASACESTQNQSHRRNHETHNESLHKKCLRIKTVARNRKKAVHGSTAFRTWVDRQCAKARRSGRRDTGHASPTAGALAVWRRPTCIWLAVPGQ